MHSCMAGALIFLPGIGVRLVFLNLSKLLPVRAPHAYVACRASRVGMLMVNSPVSSMSVWEWRPGAMLTARRGGLVEAGIAHARVVALGLPVFPTQETITVCMGCSSRVAEESFIVTFADIIHRLNLLWCAGLFCFPLGLCV